MAYTQVMRSDAIIAAEGNLARDVEKEVAILEPDEGPLTTLLMHIPEDKPTTSHKYEHLEDDGPPDYVTVSGAYNASATAITVDDASAIRPFSQLHNPLTAENFLVLSRNLSTNVLTVATRPYGDTSASAIANATKLLILSPAKAQGQAIGTPLTVIKTTQFNYTYIFETVISTANTTAVEKMEAGPNERVYQWEAAKLSHKKYMEKTLLWSTRSRETTSDADGHYRTSTGGVTQWVTQNITDMGGTMTHLELLTWARGFTRYGSRKRLVISGALGISVLNMYALAAIQVPNNQDGDTFGISVWTYRAAGMTLQFVQSNNLVDDYAGIMFALDMGSRRNWNVQLRTLRRTQEVRDAVKDGSDRVVDKIITETGLHMKSAKKHGKATGITG